MDRNELLVLRSIHWLNTGIRWQICCRWGCEWCCTCSQTAKVEEPEIIFNRNQVVHLNPPLSRWRRLPAPPLVISVRLSRWYLVLRVVLCGLN